MAYILVNESSPTTEGKCHVTKRKSAKKIQSIKWCSNVFRLSSSSVSIYNNFLYANKFFYLRSRGGFKFLPFLATKTTLKSDNYHTDSENFFSVRLKITIFMKFHWIFKRFFRQGFFFVAIQYLSLFSGPTVFPTVYISWMCLEKYGNYCPQCEKLFSTGLA